jgi:hypothetical protein
LLGNRVVPPSWLRIRRRFVLEHLQFVAFKLRILQGTQNASVRLEKFLSIATPMETLLAPMFSRDALLQQPVADVQALSV